MDGWKITLPFGMAYFQVFSLLVSGSLVAMVFPGWRTLPWNFLAMRIWQREIMFTYLVKIWGWFIVRLPKKISIFHRPKHKFWRVKNVNSFRGCINCASLFGRFQDVEDCCTTFHPPRSLLASHVGHEKLVSKINSPTWRWRWNKHIQRGYIFFEHVCRVPKTLLLWNAVFLQAHHTFKHQLLNLELEYVATGLAMTSCLFRWFPCEEIYVTDIPQACTRYFSVQ